MMRTVTLAVTFSLFLSTAGATPPDYATFKREQRAQHAPAPDALLRIWLVYIGQGDGIVIQLPRRYRDAQGNDIEILVDGGPPGNALPLFLEELLGPTATLEYAVLTHHDQDHVSGITTLLGGTDFGVGRLYHNGLVSWRADRKGFETLTVDDTDQAVFAVHRDGDAITRGMAILQADGRSFAPEFLLNSRGEAGTELAAGNLHGIYGDFISAIMAKTAPASVASFDRVVATTTLFDDLPSPAAGPPVEFQTLWPLDPPRRYANRFGSWGYSINGNSVTFRLVYGDFEMLFTGDHNDASEDELVEHVAADALRADVLKVPHHGSRHSTEAFFEAVDPVLSVASMGRRGFSRSWKHPSEEVISWAGGSHRIFHTYVHERKFRYEDLTDQVRQNMAETTHILIETDGEWFRIVETESPLEVPTVSATRRGDGTRWIRARAEEN